ncbi:hypothetical protein D3C86_1302030 [compost metagenome]
MGTLLKLDVDVLKHIDVVQYRNRSRDDFEALTGGRVTNEQFDKAYAERDNTTLSKSLITGIIPIIMKYLESIQERYMRKIDITSVRIDLNTFPYFVPGPTLQDLRSVLAALLPSYVEIGVVRLDSSMLTPEFIDKHYNGWALYDFNEWLTIHHERLLAKPINGVSTIIPRIHKRDPGEFVVDNEFFMEADKHGLFEMVMEDFIHLECLPASDFSFILPGTYKVAGD